MKFITLFAGVGGFDLGMGRAGHECVAQVEWDKNAAGVLKRRWPDVPLFCDVSKVTADDLPDADFITYGFPCQDLSVAGKRKGLEGERSGLFFEACRIIKGLAERAIRRGGAGGGRFLALAENVPGIFSSGNGLDFAGCIRELLDIGASEVGWTVLDTQHVGWRSPCGRVVRAAPQRRRRVFISATFGHFGEGTAGEIFSQQSRLRRYFEKGGKTGEDSPADAGGGFTPGGGSVTPGPGVDVYGGTETGEIACTVTTRTGCGDTSGPKAYQGGDLGGGSETVICRASDQANAETLVNQANAETLVNQASTLNCNHGVGGQIIAQACDVYNGEETGDTAATVTSATGISNASGPKVMASFCAGKGTMSKTVSTALCSNTGSPMGNGPKVIGWNGDTTPKASEDVSVTLRSQQGGEGVGVAFHATQDPIHSEEHTPTLGANATIGYQQNLTVRRLTCRECERLQGFPDDWTLEKMELELEGNEWKATGKVVKQADGPRYRACGNAVTVNVAEWIGRRLRRLQATYTLEELDELGVGTTYPKTLGEYLREDCG